MISAWLEPFGWALLHCLWQISIVALIYRAAKPLLRHRPQAAYRVGLALLAVALLAVGSTFLVQLFTSASEPSAENTRPALSKRDVAARLAVVTPIDTASMPSSRFADRVASSLEPYLRVTVFIWIVGVALVGYRFRRAYQLCNTLRRSARTATSPAILDGLTRIRRQMKLDLPIEVAISSHIDSPVVIGWRPPVILLPSDLERSLSQEEIEAALAHEMAHIKRCDYPINLVQTAIERLFFFHPALRWLSREIRLTRELCCDELAAAAISGGVLGYAKSLIRLEEIRSTSMIALGLHDGNLMRRIARLLAEKAAPAESNRRPNPIAAPRSKIEAALSLVALGGAALTLLLGVWVVEASTSARTVLGGLDPVYLAEGLEIEGKPAISAYAGGYRYLFADRESMERFRTSPERFSVRNSDYCPVSGRPTRPDVWRLVAGRPTLFCCDSVPDALLPKDQIADISHPEH